MAGEVSRCLKGKKNLLIEAGTGVGKSFAYLIPAILSHEKTVVSTASLALQDQLVSKDLVFLQKELPQKFSFGILKGKNNYLCLKREREFTEISQTYMRFRKWLAETRTGEKDELPFIPEFWSKVCGDSQDCNGRTCPLYNGCFYYRHYRHLFKKDILVVNHHLLIYDLLSDFSILPFHEQLIIDEAPEVENVISHVLGSTLSYSRVAWLLYRLKGLKIIVDPLFAQVESFFKGMDMPSQAVFPIPAPITEKLKDLNKILALNRVVSTLEKHKNSVSDDELRDRIETTIGYVTTLTADIDDFIEQNDTDRVYYMAGNNGALELKSALVESRNSFEELISNYDSVIMTSATLASGGNFVFLKKRLGIEDFEERVIGSPFDYRKQALLHIDKDLPLPEKGNNERFQQESLKVMEGLINASRGRALVLFTSYKHLHFVSKNIKIHYPFKSQGDMPPARLIEWFKDTSHSVLLATATFWQGIDIKGEKLSLVVIAKLPFSSPGDPVYQERCRRLKDRWFNDLALPSAILVLRQGFGRLIRGRNEYGVVAILDRRLVTRSYGKTIVSSLPDMNIVHSVEDVKRFFDSVPATAHKKKAQTAKVPVVKGVDSGDPKGIDLVVALGKSNNPTVISEIIKFTRSSNGNERRLAASALGKLARFKPEIYVAVEALEGLLEDEKPQVRQYALKALGTIGMIDKEMLETIIKNPYEKDYNVSIAKRLLRKAK
ncbi:MAG: HEAT repeat domain-containing protein [Deltaproteobacteria bacterium]|nr:HEAT repeat domain-containing protein [Deltaproteobacteria bacterium]